MPDQEAAASAGATLVDPFTIRGNSLGAKDWNGCSNEWYTGSGDSGHWEDINCGAHFRYDLNNYLATAGTKIRSVQVCCGAMLPVQASPTVCM